MHKYNEVRHSGHGPCLNVGQQLVCTSTMRSDTLVIVLDVSQQVACHMLRAQVQ